MATSTDSTADNTNGSPVDVKTKFAFGRNWRQFLKTLDEKRIASAQDSVKTLLGIDDFSDKRFLDAGCGSGLFSLAAYRLGAKVTSFDVDAQSVACAEVLKTQYAGSDQRWEITTGSLLQQEFVTGLGDFDVVYCWGVVHHTGDMWKVIEYLTSIVSPSGHLVLAIYNDELHVSRAWRGIKKIYSMLPSFLRPIYVFLIGTMLFLSRAWSTAIACLIRIITLRNPLTPILNLSLIHI